MRVTTGGEDETASLTEALVDRCLAIDAHELPDATRDRVHVLFRDGLGVLLGSATTTASSEMARDVATVVYGDGDATVTGGGTAPTPAAAFANGTILHGIELDDTHSGASTHPGTVVIPVLLAVGETEGSTGSEALAAMVAGYECMVRIGRGADPVAQYERGFHPTAVCGVFGAALTAAKLKGLTPSETVNALGIAGSFAAGNLEYLAEGVLSKRIQPGHAAQGGVLAAELAARGYTGPRTILEGENGFLDGYSDRADPDAVLADVDDDLEFEVTRTGVKPHACCRYNQTPIDAVLELERDHGIDPADVESIHLEIVETAIPIVAEPRAEKVRPQTETAAQFSLLYSVAVALSEGRAFFEQFREPYLSDESILALADRMSVEHGEDLESYYPEYFPARTTIRTTDGGKYGTMLRTCRGDPANPLPEADLREKYHALATNYLGEEEADELERIATDLPAVDDVSEVTRFLRE